MLIRVSPEDPADRIDKFVSEKTGITRSQVLRLIEKALITVNGLPTKPNYRIRQGDNITVTVPEQVSESLVPQDIPLDILHMDEHLAVINKPAGLVVHPAAGHRTGTLMNALLYRAKKLATIGGPLRPGVVHRLDKDTSGVIVVALSDQAYYGLIEQFKGRAVRRRYLALIYGTPKAEHGEISRGIGRSVADRKKMSVRSRHAKEARTFWRVLRKLRSSSLIEARLATGRTHQIRVHLASIGHPVLGDRTYGGKTSLRVGGETVKFPRQMLHAEYLGFVHPITGKEMEFTAPPPEDMKEAMRTLGASVEGI